MNSHWFTSSTRTKPFSKAPSITTWFTIDNMSFWWGKLFSSTASISQILLKLKFYLKFLLELNFFIQIQVKYLRILPYRIFFIFQWFAGWCRYGWRRAENLQHSENWISIRPCELFIEGIWSSFDQIFTRNLCHFTQFFSKFITFWRWMDHSSWK